MSHRVLAMKHGTFKGVWYPWCSWIGMRMWRLHCWDPPVIDPEHCQHWWKKLHSWGMNQSPKRLRRLLHLPWMSRNFQTQRTNWVVWHSKVQLPLHPWHNTPIMTSPRWPVSINLWSRQSQWMALCIHQRDRKELLSWWQQFRSLCHKGTRPLSDSQVQELAGNQAAAFRLPAA